MSIPYIGFGNDTLNKLPKVKSNDSIICNHCGKIHKLIPDDDGKELVLFYKCSGEIYIAAIAGRLIDGVKSDYSGEI